MVLSVIFMGLSLSPVRTYEWASQKQALDWHILSQTQPLPNRASWGWEWGDILVWNKELPLPHVSIRNVYFFHLKLVMFWTDDDSKPASTQTGAQVPRALWAVGKAQGGPSGPGLGPACPPPALSAASLEEEECTYVCVCARIYF